MLRRLVTIIVLFSSTTSQAQIFGGDPPSVQWRQVNTPLARVIFPRGLDSIGDRIASIITRLNSPMLATIGPATRKINIVAQAQTTQSNAYVALGPFRSEFYMTPAQNSFELGSLPWPDQLTIHEFRHVQQDNNFDVGLSRVMHDLFGENGQALANNAAIPNWFYEGDAVYNETNVSRQGRGMLPSFYNGYRALWKDGRNYSWMKLRNGSFRDFVPDHYPLGFMMVAYGRQFWGDRFWEQVTHDAAAFRGGFYPFQRAILRYSGESYHRFREEALDYFKARFDLQNVPPGTTGRHRIYEDERYPVFLSGDSILFVQSGFLRVPRFTIRYHNRDMAVRTRDFSLDEQFSYRNGRLVYAAYVPDSRWGYRDYSDLRLLNLATGREVMLTRHTKYFSPDISPDGTRVIAVNVPPDARYCLHLLDAHNGKILRVIPNPDHLFYTYPKFYRGDTVLTAVRNSLGEMSLALIPLGDGKPDYLLPFSYEVIGVPFVRNDTVYFSRSGQRDDGLFALSLADRTLWSLAYPVHVGAGRYEPAAGQQGLLWVEFTSLGYKIQEIPLRAERWVAAGEPVPDTIPPFGITALRKTNYDLLGDVPRDTLPGTAYHKGFRLFNFHSIQPQVNDPDYTLNFLSENILNTLLSQVSLNYNRAERSKQVGFSADYGGWFPVFSAGFNYTFDRKTLYHDRVVAFNEAEPYVGFHVPLDLSHNRTFTFLDAGSQYVYNESRFPGIYKDSIGNITYGYSSNFITFNHQTQSTLQRVYPKFAQVIRLTGKFPVTRFRGYQVMADARAYFPGLAPTHSFIGDLAVLGRDTLRQLNFSSDFPFSRGYAAINLYRMLKWGIDYHFPIAYPDAGFGEILYLMRIRGDVFYDDTRAKDFSATGAGFNARFRSAGAEVYFDTKWWNETPISFGLRYSRLLDEDLFGGTGRNRLEIILPVNIFNQ